MLIRKSYFGIALLIWSSFCYSDNIFVICRSVQGLDLINQSQPPMQAIQHILQDCDKSQPNTVNVLLLHGLLARKLSMADKNYQSAIDWLQKAAAVASADNNVPLLELATTYEWAMQTEQAKKIYAQLLRKNPYLPAALLGQARIFIQQNNLKEASQLYEMVLQKNPSDIEAMNGLARVLLAKKDYEGAENKFQQVLALKPNDENAQLGLQQIKAAVQKPIISAEKPPVIELSPAIIEPVVDKIPVAQQSASPVVQPPTPAPPSNTSLTCPVNQGLQLLNQKPLPLNQIKKIIAECNLQQPDDVQVLLLNGLLARTEAKTTKKFKSAIGWLQKAVAKAPPTDTVPALELAITYEWNLQQDKAKDIYMQLLKKDPKLLAALLGLGRLALAEKHLQDATKIYTGILKSQPNNIDALNGLARVSLEKKDFSTAKLGFEKVLKIAANNEEAKVGLSQVRALQLALTTVEPPGRCPVNEGLQLLNEANPPMNQIQDILAQCDAEDPNDVQVLLLHGLFARYAAKTTHHYQLAISWLQKAYNVATADNESPGLELATTYEWNKQFSKAKTIYEQILQINPNSRAALLGLARVNQAQYRIKLANEIYLGLLQKNPDDIEVLNALAMLEMMNKKFTAAKNYLTKAQALDPENEEILLSLNQLSNATKYRLDVIGGQYSVEGQKSIHSELNFFADINATDQILVMLEHNSDELAIGLFFDPTTLPSNSASLGFTRQYPDEYGFSVKYDARERKTQPEENRFAFNANLYVFSNLQWFAGVREGFPTPFNNQLFWSGLTLYTPLPANLTVTQYLGYQELPNNPETIKSRATSVGLSKEYPNYVYYNVGFSYSPTTPVSPWGVFGKLVLPTWKHQAIEATYEHFFSNDTTFFTLGWRIYW